MPARFKFLKNKDGSRDPRIRDPRENPQPGDVIRGICIGVGRSCSYHVRRVEDDAVHFDFGREDDSQKASMKQWREWTAGKDFERAENRAAKQEAKAMPKISGHARFIKVVESLLWELEQIDDKDLTVFERRVGERFRSLLGKDGA